MKPTLSVAILAQAEHTKFGSFPVGFQASVQVMAMISFLLKIIAFTSIIKGAFAPPSQSSLLVQRIGAEVEAVMADTQWAELVGTSSRVTRATIFKTFMFGTNANANARQASQALACLISVFALTKSKNRALKLMKGLVHRNVQGADVALRFLAKMPARARDSSQMISVGSFGAGVPEMLVLARIANPELASQGVRTGSGWMSSALVCPELTQLRWGPSCRSLIEAADRYFWEEIVQDTRSRSRGSWNQSIFQTKWADEYGFITQQEVALLHVANDARAMGQESPPAAWFNDQAQRVRAS